MRYKHTQIGHTIIWVALGAAVFVATMGTFAQGGPGTSLIVEVILLICAVMFCKLTIRIDDETLRWSFGIGIVRKQVLLAEIAACEPIRIRWWNGWGIHLQCFWFGRCSHQVARWTKIRVGHGRSTSACRCNRAFDQPHPAR